MKRGILPEATSPRRRRSRGQVTQNACTECKRKRAKCDGQTPCGGCTAKNISDCTYEVPIRISKEQMRQEIEQLQGQLYTRDIIVEALATGEKSDLILQRLKDKIPLEEVADEVRRSFPTLSTRRLAPPARDETLSSEMELDTNLRVSERGEPPLSDLGKAMRPGLSTESTLYSDVSMEKDEPEQIT